MTPSSPSNRAPTNLSLLAEISSTPSGYRQRIRDSVAVLNRLPSGNHLASRCTRSRRDRLSSMPSPHWAMIVCVGPVVGHLAAGVVVDESEAVKAAVLVIGAVGCGPEPAS